MIAQGYDGSMCGRYTLTVSAKVLAEVFGVAEDPTHAPRYNIAPTQQVPLVRGGAGAARELGRARWGLVPSWAEDPSIGNRLINARSESAAGKPAFRAAVRQRRALMPADGFYEWVRTGGRKQPHLIRYADRRVFAFAALWERWRGPGGGDLVSCTILTTSPNDLVAPLHDRMPVILDPPSWDEWLAPEPPPPPRFAELTAPRPAAGMVAFPVSMRVNSPANDDPECLAPLPPTPG